MMNSIFYKYFENECSFLFRIQILVRDINKDGFESLNKELKKMKKNVGSGNIRIVECESEDSDYEKIKIREDLMFDQVFGKLNSTTYENY